MRVIQDSDDDDDSLEINAPPQQQPDASAEGPLPTFASLPPDGTGSTGESANKPRLHSTDQSIRIIEESNPENASRSSSISTQSK